MECTNTPTWDAFAMLMIAFFVGCWAFYQLARYLDGQWGYQVQERQEREDRIRGRA